MRICYILLSPTFGMHQYTADLANRMVESAGEAVSVHLVTSSNYPADRYAPAVQVHMPLTSRNTGLALTSLNMRRLQAIWRCVQAIQPDLVHFTGPHLWNVLLLRSLRRAGIPTIHTLHDLDPHLGARGGRLLHGWNGLVLRLADRILVHGQTYKRRLCQRPWLSNKVVYTPLLHLFVSHTQARQVAQLATSIPQDGPSFILFFGRLQRYKGVGDLLTAYAQLRGLYASVGQPETAVPRLILAGPGELDGLWAGNLPPGVEVRDRLIHDEEAVELFRQCSLLVLPYLDGTQSALIPAAYFFGKPVVATRVGALAEYVEEGQTGLLVEPGHPASLTRALYAILSRPDRLTQMGQAGRLWYQQRREQETRALCQLYERPLTSPEPTATGGQRLFNHEPQG